MIVPPSFKIVMPRIFMWIFSQLDKIRFSNITIPAEKLDSPDEDLILWTTLICFL